MILPRIVYLFKLTLFEFHRIYIFYQTKRDARCLRSKFKNINFDELFQKSYKELKPYYNNYVPRITRDDMAISLQLASFILTFCRLTKPKKIADLGSGFSSFVFRYYASQCPYKVDIWSVDDGRKWLEKTRVFLSKNKLSTKNLIHFSEFKKMHQAFDLILHDIGTMETRIETVVYAMNLAKKGGFIILDDMHFPAYSPIPKTIIRNTGFTALSTRNYTKDKYGRFSYVIHATNEKIISWQLPHNQ